MVGRFIGCWIGRLISQWQILWIQADSTYTGVTIWYNVKSIQDDGDNSRNPVAHYGRKSKEIKSSISRGYFPPNNSRKTPVAHTLGRDLGVWWVLRLPEVCPWHSDVIKWKHFPRYWSFVQRIHRWLVNSPHKGQWRGALMISTICAWTNGWINNREAGDLRRHRAHYDVNVMGWFTTLMGLTI